MTIVDQEQEEVRTPASLGDIKVIYLHIQPELDEDGNPTGGTERSVKCEFTVVDQDGEVMKTRRPVVTDRLVAEYPQKAQEINQWVNWFWGVVESEVL